MSHLYARVPRVNPALRLLSPREFKNRLRWDAQALTGTRFLDGGVTKAACGRHTPGFVRPFKRIVIVCLDACRCSSEKKLLCVTTILTSSTCSQLFHWSVCVCVCSLLPPLHALLSRQMSDRCARVLPQKRHVPRPVVLSGSFILSVALRVFPFSVVHCIVCVYAAAGYCRKSCAIA